MLNTLASNVSKSNAASFGFWPERIEKRPSIKVGLDSIYFSAVDVTGVQVFLSSYVTATQVSNWSITSDNIAVNRYIVGVAFDSANQIAYVCSGDVPNSNNFYLASIDLTTGVITTIGTATILNFDVANSASNVVGRFDAATSRIHWVGLADTSSPLYVVQNIDSTIASQSTIRLGGAISSVATGAFYITRDYNYALVVRAYSATGGYKFGILDLNALESTSMITGMEDTNRPIDGGRIILDYDGYAVSSSTSSGNLTGIEDGPIWSDVALSEAVYGMVRKVGFSP